MVYRIVNLANPREIDNDSITPSSKFTCEKIQVTFEIKVYFKMCNNFFFNQP